jgi:exodeoxyribonuclease VII large subunit
MSKPRRLFDDAGNALPTGDAPTGTISKPSVAEVPKKPQQPCTVTEITEQIRASLEGNFSNVWVRGEVNEVVRASSGHVYLTLKDAGAQLKAVIWKGQASRIRFDLKEGQEVICQGDISLYPPRGAYQLVVKAVEPVGQGALQLAFMQLREKLQAEGLFDPARKKPVPRWPKRIALITSPTGAAVRDFVQIACRRWPGVQVLIIPAKVQGEGAAADIVRGIGAAHKLPVAPDVLILCRGGGSLEDLWCFNEELVVRAVGRSRIPTISAIGHEIDVTLCDLVADIRALTPSEAAERFTPDIQEMFAALAQTRQLMVQALRRRALRARQLVDAVASRRVLRRPFDLIIQRGQLLDELQSRAGRAQKTQLAKARQQLENAAARLETLSPISTLKRGYSITLVPGTNTPIRDVSQVGVGQTIETQLSHGKLLSRVEEIRASFASGPSKSE